MSSVTDDVQVDFPVARWRSLKVDPASVSACVISSNPQQGEHCRWLRSRVKLSQQLLPAPSVGGAGSSSCTNPTAIEGRVLGPNLTLVVRDLVTQIEAVNKV